MQLFTVQRLDALSANSNYKHFLSYIPEIQDVDF